MEENTQEVKQDGASPAQELEKAPDSGSAGTEETTPETKPEMVPLSELERQSEALKKAEDAVVKYKRIAEAAKQAGYVEAETPKEDIDALIDQKLEEKLSSLKQQPDDEVQAIRRERHRLDEIAASLRAKQAISNTSAGTNQDRKVPEPEPNLNAIERAILERRSSAAGVTLQEFIKQHPLG